MLWLERLRALPTSKRGVQHEPETERYSRARAKLAYVIREAKFLGMRPSELGEDTAVEIAVWCRAPDGRGYGYYSCFRLYLKAGEVTYGVMFAFYDGTEGSVGLKTLGSARMYANEHGFNGEQHG